MSKLKTVFAIGAPLQRTLESGADFLDCYLQNLEPNFAWGYYLESKSLESIGVIRQFCGQEIRRDFFAQSLNLSQVIAKIQTSFEGQDIIRIVLITMVKNGSVWQLKSSSNTLCQLELYRLGKHFSLPIHPKGLSGQLKIGDILALGNETFIRTQQLNPNPHSFLIQTQECFTGLLIKIEDILETEATTDFLHTLISKVKLPQKETKNLYQVPTIPILQLSEKRIVKQRRWSVILALIFSLCLMVSLGLGYQKKQAFSQNQKDQQLLSDVRYRLEQAKNLKNLNPSRTKDLLQEASQILSNYTINGDLASQLDDLKAEIDVVYSEVFKKYAIHNPNVFYKLNLVANDFSASHVSLSGNWLSLLDSNKKMVASINIESKKAEVLVGEDIVLPDSLIASNDSSVFLSSNGKLQMINRDEKAQKDSFSFGKIAVDQFVGFGSNLYVLDKTAGQIWRLRGTSNNKLTSADKFFAKNQDLTSVSQMTIDGAIWLYFESGELAKYTGGVKDAYYEKLALDMPLGKNLDMYSDGDAQSLYFLDRDNHRVVVVSKTAQYQKQYVSAFIGEKTLMVVSEPLRQVFLINSDIIYSIGL